MRWVLVIVFEVVVFLWLVYLSYEVDKLKFQLEEAEEDEQ